MSTEYPDYANMGWPRAITDGFLRRAVVTSIVSYDSSPGNRPRIFDILPPGATPMGRSAYEQFITINPGGVAKIAGAGIFPHLVEGAMKKVWFKTMPVKEGYQVFDLDRVAGLPNLIATKSQYVSEFLRRAVDKYSFLNIWGDAGVMANFNPSGEWAANRQVLTAGVDFVSWDTATTSTPLKDLDEWILTAKVNGAPQGTPTLYVGPNTFKVLKSHEVFTEILKYTNGTIISNKNGVIQTSLHGIPVVEVDDWYKINSETDPDHTDEGDMYSVGDKDSKVFFMEDPADNTIENALLVFPGLGRTEFAKTAPSHRFETGEPMVREQRNEMLEVTTYSASKWFCSRIENPYAAIILKGICASIKA